MKNGNVTMKLVLLPGMDGTGKLFRPFVDKLPPEIEANVIPLLQQIDISYEQQAEYVAESIDDASVIIAESYSGMVALKLLEYFPEKVAKIVFVASFIGRPSALAKLVYWLPPFVLTLAKKPNPLSLRLLFGRYLNPQLRTLFYAAIDDVPIDVLVFRLRQIAQLQKPHVALMSTCTCLCGKQDNLVANQALRDFEEVFGEVKVVYLNGTHFLMQTNPEECWKAIEAIAFEKATN